MGIREAADVRENPNAGIPLIVPIPCPMPVQPQSVGHMYQANLMGKMRVTLKPDSFTAGLYHKTEVFEQIHCNSGLNPEYQYLFDDQDLKIVGWADDGSVRVAELPGHPFYLTTLYMPQLASTPETPALIMVE